MIIVVGLRDISETIIIQEEEEQVVVSLHANQFQKKSLNQYKNVLNKRNNYLQGHIKISSDEELRITYDKSSTMINLNNLLKKISKYERLLLTQKLSFLEETIDTNVQPFIHPSNLFVFGDQIVVAHRGFLDKVVPYTYNYDINFQHYRALILFIINPKLNFEQLIEGSGTLKDPLSMSIQDTTTYDQLNAIIGEQVALQKEKRLREEKVVNKNKYMIFKWGTILLSVATIILSILTWVYNFNIVPGKNRVITAEAQFISNDYSGTLKTLKNDKPEDLPIGAKYAAAVSSVQLDGLSNEQKEVILNNLSQKSSDNTLLYWIYIGKGDFNKALDIAQNVGDNQYILHAYTKLYDSTKVNNKMKGSKKQELLKEYEEEIQKYMDVLGGKTDEESK